MTGTIEAEELFRLASQKSKEGRSSLAETISDLFLEGGRVLTERERILMFDILHKIIVDVEQSVRKTLSEAIADQDDLPPDLAATFANDDVEVAFPILSRSKVLQDFQLIEVIHHRTLEHQLAIAIRSKVSEGVCDALVETGDESVIRTLLENKNADISKKTMEYLAEQSKRVDSFQEPILRRDDLDPGLAKKMFLWVSAALRKFIIDNFQLDKSTVDDLMERVALAQGDSDSPAGNSGSNGKVDELAQDLEKENLATTDMLLSSLKDGEVSLFLTLFAKMTGLRNTLVKRIVFEPGGDGLAIACKAVEIKSEDFLIIFDLSRKARPGEEKKHEREVRHVTNLYEKMTPQAAKKVLRMWQRDSNYLAAIRELELNA